MTQNPTQDQAQESPQGMDTQEAAQAHTDALMESAQQTQEAQQSQTQPQEEESSYQEKTVPELKDELAERDLPKSGKKDDLVARLEEDDQQS